ncbi:calcium/sodium antiporter [Salinirubrum litoreum]|uniref:Calcium/sodium antiporter n=1 Tax=Salinirubrum litoreum TaxID=1126234 RepID=A0ABD5RAT1_9EURY
MVTTSVAVDIGIVVVAVLGLWLGARTMVDGSVRLARGIGLSETVIGLTLVAVGTSTPELVVSVDAALVGAGDVAIGNVVGSNVYNLAFILGVVSLVRVIPITRSLVKRDGVVLLGATFLLAGFLVDLRVSRIEGLLAVGLMIAYTAYLLRTTPEESDSVDETDESGDSDSPVEDGKTGSPVENGGTESATAGIAAVPPGAVAERVATESRLRTLALTLGGLAVVLVSGHFLVESAVSLARAGGLSEWAIGATVVAGGTSTPEFAVSLVALRRGSAGVSVGNVVGSNVFNALGVVGLAALISPAVVTGEALGSVVWLLVVTVVAVTAMWTGRRLSRPEGGLFAGSEVLRWTSNLLGLG